MITFSGRCVPIALIDLNKVVSLDPKYIYAYLYRARIKYKLNDKSGAISDYNQIIQAYPTFEDAFIARADIKK